MFGARPVLASLAAIPFFGGLEPAALERLAAAMRARRFRRGEVIFHIGDPGDALFVIVSGEVKISLPSETGDEAILATLRPGDVFGELALLDGAPRSASASALSPDRDRRPAARTLSRADRHRDRGPRRAPGLDRRRAAASHDPCRGAALPRHHRPAGRAARSTGTGGRHAGRGWLDPPSDEPDPGGPGRDGRLHAAEREQAAGAVHRRRPGPARARCASCSPISTA